MINTSGCSRVNYYILELTDAATCKCSVREGVLRNFATFAGKYLCQSLFSNEVAGLRSATLLKKRLWHSCFPVNFTKFLKTPFSEHLWTAASTSRKLLFKFLIKTHL